MTEDLLPIILLAAILYNTSPIGNKTLKQIVSGGVLLLCLVRVILPAFGLT